MSKNNFDAWKKIYFKAKVKMLLFQKRHSESRQQAKIIVKTWANENNMLSFAQRVYRDLQDWASYYDIYHHVHELYPDSISIKLNYGSALFSSSRYEDAETQFTYCVNNWNFGSNYTFSLNNLKARLAICYEYLGRQNDAAKLLDEIGQPTQPDLDVFFAFYLHALSTAQEKVLPYLDEQIRLFPKVFILYYWKGIYSQYYLHNFDFALELYLKSLQTVDYSTIKNMCSQYMTCIEPAEVSRKAVKLYIKSGKIRAALNLLRKIKLKSYISGFDFDLSIEELYVKALAGYYFDVEQKIQKRLKRKMYIPKETAYWLLLAYVQVKKGDLEASKNSFSRILMLDSESRDVHKLLGCLQMVEKEWQSCIDTYLKLTKINRFNSTYWINLGYSYSNVGDVNLAIVSYKQALAINPFEANTWIDLANLYVDVGKKELAMDAIENGLKYTWLDVDKKKIAIEITSRIET
jgi:tetratricopeptide (TPR) repeat protein